MGTPGWMAREEAAPQGRRGLRGQASGGGRWEEGGNLRVGRSVPAQARAGGLPSLDMPTSKHFCSRQY